MLGNPVPRVGEPNPQPNAAAGLGLNDPSQARERFVWWGTLPKLTSASDSERRKIYFFNFTYIKSGGNKKIFKYKKRYQKKRKYINKYIIYI